MANLSTQKGKATVQVVRTVDATVMYLPPDRPDLNPIEQVFSKIKNER